MQDLLETYIQEGNTGELERLLYLSPELAVQKTSRKLSPLMLACYLKKPQIAEIIVKYLKEPDLFESAALGRFDWVAHQVFKNPESINAYSELGFTALGLAVYFGHEDVTRYLLLKGADPNLPARNASGVFPLQIAVLNKQNMLAKLLLEGGAAVNVFQQTGITPLHVAASQGNIELIICFLEAGADVKAKTEIGKTPGDWAAEKGWAEIARILND
jgi:ankyrin repeat protein